MPDLMKALKPELEGKTPQELDSMLRSIIGQAKADGKSFDELSEEDLHMVAAITGQLRRKSAGPPKEKKAASKKGKASTEDLMDML